MACHNAIWELAAALIETGINPDKLSHPELAAELTNHLVDGAVLTPGAADAARVARSHMSMPAFSTPVSS